ncbi:hypothetical protein [Clostridium botulinum]|uniref:hypothetical protein n=1 Tax=Clostridium botulinum TaxID=1491 RepID=UPI002201BC4D|nr:hypothetical protein [Clostridium botulinum]QDY30821.1 hypothetical protein CGQ41_18845 [Clostridium botulinum]
MKTLKELTNDEALEAVKIYYENRDLTIREICELLDIKYNSNFIRSIKLYSDDLCENCGGRVRYILESREYRNSGINEDNKICENCGHCGNVEICNCNKCRKTREMIREEEEKRRLNLLCSRFYVDTINISEVSVREAIFLALAIRKSESKYLGFIFEKDYFKNLSYKHNESIDIIKNLIKINAIKINVNKSNINTFEFLEDNTILYSMAEVYYEVNVKELIDIEFDEVENVLSENYTKGEFVEYWYDICINESLFYLDMQTQSYDLGYVEIIRDDIKALISDLIIKFELGEIFYLIDYSVRRASNFKVQCNPQIQNVHKAILTNMRKTIEKGYYLYKYNRPNEMPETSMYAYITNNVLGLKKGYGFNIIDKNSKQEKMDIKSYKIEDLGNKKDELDVIKEFENLSIKIKSLRERGIPDSFIIESLQIKEEILEAAIKYK